MIAEIAPANIKNALIEAEPQYLEDAGELLCDLVDRQHLLEHLNRCLEQYEIRVYHGSRLTNAEIERVQAEGLKPLRVEDRKEVLQEILSRHPKWDEVGPSLGEVLRDFGPGERGGRREDGCVHVCFSRTGLTKGCNHYLTHGAEVDGHIVHTLFPDDESALNLLRSQRKAVLITFLSPFAEAVHAANPWGVPQDSLSSLLGMFIEAWAYHQAHPSFTTVSLQDCTAARFGGPIPASRIEQILEVPEWELAG